MGKKKRKRFKIAISYAKEKPRFRENKTAPYKPKLSISQQLGFHL